jgi:hypothetical protein
MNKVAVVIPVYKNTLSIDERLSLVQCGKILGNYPIKIVAPEGMEVSEYKRILPQCVVEFFPSNYFRDTFTYSKLLMKSLFYKRFRNYEYMLIYQPDAFVFRDELMQWCERDFDYIGAPWINEDWIHQLKRDIHINFNNSLINKVGNGGLSLRKISTAVRACKLLYLVAAVWWKNEDIFWSNVVPRLMKFRLPEIATALKFSFDLDPERCYEMNDRKLPFGCHAWNKNYDFWKPYIEEASASDQRT